MSVLGEDDDKQRVEVQTLHQQPEEVGHDEVLEEHEAGFTSHLKNTHRGQRCILEADLKVKDMTGLQILVSNLWTLKC